MVTRSHLSTGKGKKQVNQQNTDNTVFAVTLESPRPSLSLLNHSIHSAFNHTTVPSTISVTIGSVASRDL